MLKKAALYFGIVVLAVGILGFVPGITMENDEGAKLLLGIFHVDALHNVVHILTGAVAIAASQSRNYARLYFQVFGVVYAIVTVIGFVQGDSVLGLFPVNLADNFLHVLIAAAALYLGFGTKAGGGAKPAVA